jgi:hypothetical protein
MAKFAKRLRKLSGYTENALVVGTAFGNLDQLLEIYTNVFVVDDEPPSAKARNLIYKENFNDLNVLTQVGAIFIDLDKIDQLEILEDFWQRHKSTIFVEGNDCILRHLSKPLFKTGWQCTSLQGIYHVWEKIK